MPKQDIVNRLLDVSSLTLDVRLTIESQAEQTVAEGKSILFRKACRESLTSDKAESITLPATVILSEITCKRLEAAPRSSLAIDCGRL